MIPNDTLINALRSLNFRFKRQTDRVAIYKQKGTTLRVAIRRNQLHDETYTRTVLRQAGMALADINNFISSAKRSN